jgi:hypothetical protein
MEYDIREIARHFRIEDTFMSAAPYGSGHINDTFAGVFDRNGSTIRYIHQRINHDVFKDPVLLMENVDRVTRHQHAKLEEENATDVKRRALTIVPASDGLPYYRDGEGNTWRTYVFIEKATSYDVIETPAQATEAAAGFGEFQKQLSDLGGKRLHETIPAFHYTPGRFESFEAVLAADRLNRAAGALDEIGFAFAHRDMCGVLVEKQASGEVPERVTHNDTKLNNVMLDDATGKAICVIDLDTVMPGLVLYDFGDMVRTATSTAAEDEKDLSKVAMRMPMFEALVDGYLSSAEAFLTAAEKEHLAFGGKLLTFETGLRFLTDYLEGDIYFKIHRDGHNLDRCRTQFKLVASMEEQEEAMNRYVAKWCGATNSRE